MEKETKITNFSELVEYLDEKFEGITSDVTDLKIDVTDIKTAVKSLRVNVKDLQKGVFTETEKEEVLAMVRTHDKQLENDTLGRETITLTRPEYDRVAESTGFSNRFKSKVA